MGIVKIIFETNKKNFDYQILELSKLTKEERIVFAMQFNIKLPEYKDWVKINNVNNKKIVKSKGLI